MPGYRQRKANITATTSTLTNSNVTIDVPSQHLSLICSQIDKQPCPLTLSVIPVHMGFHASAFKAKDVKSLKNNNIPSLASETIRSAWAIYGFNSGHFISTLASTNMGIDIVLCADPLPTGRAMFKQFTSSPVIETSTDGLVKYLSSINNRCQIHGYFFHSHEF